MTNDEKWEHVEKILTLMKIQTDKFDKAVNGLMIAPESPLVEPNGWLEQFLIETLEKLIDDKDENIFWYVYECDYGENPKEAGYENDMREIKTVDDLRWLVELNLEKEKWCKCKSSAPSKSGSGLCRICDKQIKNFDTFWDEMVFKHGEQNE